MILFAGCASEAPETGPVPAAVASEAPDLVMLAFAGARADSGLVEAIPAVPAWRFTSAYAQSPSSFVSLGSVLTGHYVGAIPMCGFHLDPAGREDTEQAPWCAAVPGARYTLPEVLALYDYDTTFVSSGFPGASRLAGEFKHAVDLPLAGDGTDWSRLRSVVAERWGAAAGRPRFLVVATADLRFGARESVRHALGLPIVERVADAESGRAARLRYEEVARSLGGEVTALVGELARTPRAPGAWIALFGTNGLSLTEPLGDGNEGVPPLTEHIVLDRTVRVPLALYAPGGAAPATADAPVELIDLFPTLARIAGVPAPADLPGDDLRVPEGGSPVAYAEFGDMIGLRKGPHFLLFRCLLHFGTSLDPEVTQRLAEAPGTSRPYYHTFDVAADPAQAGPVDDPEVTRALWEDMVAIRRGPAAAPAGAVDAKRLWEIRMSRSQGYW